MKNTYLIGDLVLTKTLRAITSFVYIFNGAKETEKGWTVYFTNLVDQGYAGGGSTVKFQVSEGEALRLGDTCKARIKNPLKPSKAGSDKKVNKIYFDKIEKDMIELSFDFI